MDKLLVEKNIKEVIEKLKDEIPEDKKVICDWHSSYADISVVEEKEGINYIYFSANIYDDGVYSMGNTSYNYDYILDDYFTNVENLIDYHEFKELLDLDKNFAFFVDKDDDELDYYFGLEREFELRLEREAVELTAHKEGITYSLHRDPKGEDWNLTVLVENQPASDTRGNYRDCFDELRREVKYADLFIELTRQGKMVNINNTNEDGFKEGLWVVPKEDEWIKEEICFFENDKLNGKFAEIFKNNEIAEIGTYKDNIKEGKAFSYYDETLNLKEEKNYENGVLNGKYKNFLYTGELSCEGNMKNGEFDGTLKSYDSTKDGKLFLWQIMEYKNGVEQGPGVNFYENGNIKSSFNFVNGELNGKCTDFYENGNIKTISNFENSKLNGASKTYFLNGVLANQAEWENGVLHGKKIDYLENGSKIGETEYNKGLIEQELFYKKGQLERVKNYELGNLKEEKTYDENLKKSMIFTYKEDNTVNWKGYYPNGNLKFDNNLKDNLFIGSSKLYYENGNLMESSNYIIKDNEALKDGEYKSFDKNGILVENLKYQEGKVIENLLEKDNLCEKENDNPWEDKLNNNSSDLER
ncbi:MAG: toxin-antitoxin system YwqK family antitoxin [Fusobacterium sp.]